MKKHLNLKYESGEYEVEFGKYRNGQTAITCRDAETGEPVAHFTAAVDGTNISDTCVVVKDYSENEGTVKALVEAGIIGSPIGTLPSGFVELSICPLTEESKKELEAVA